MAALVSPAFLAAGGLGRDSVAPDGGLSRPPPGYEPDDYGEEVESWAGFLRRTGRRLEVWSGDRDLAVHHARLHRHQTAPDNFPASTSHPVTNGTGKKRRSQHSPEQMSVGETGGRSGLGARNTGRDLNDEITQDLLAERSDDDMDDEDSDGDGEESDVDML